MDIERLSGDSPGDAVEMETGAWEAGSNNTVTPIRIYYREPGLGD
jgi:hypothetical protein